jgi:MFS family permease
MGLRSTRRILGLAFIVTLVTTLPPFLTGALAGEISRTLNLQPAVLGTSIGGFFLAAALGSVGLGRTVDSKGWRSSMQTSSAISGISLVGIGTLGTSLAGFAGFLALGGLSMSIGNPAVNLALATEIPPQRQGLVFGIKHSAVPASAFLSGLALPVFALNVGWRPVFIGAGLLALGSVLLLSKTRESASQLGAGKRGRSGELRFKPLTAMASGAFFAAMGASALSAFLVLSLIDSGVTASNAGLLLGLASIGGLGMRLLAGWTVDRKGGTGLGGVAGLLAVGALGSLMLTANSLWILTVGAVVAFAAGWGWNGLFNFAVVKYHSDAPGRASSIALVGTYLGAASGPVLFGLLAGSTSFDVGWLVTAGISLIGSGVILLARSMLVSGGLAHQD